MRVALRRPGAMRAPLSIGMSAARRAEPTRDELGSMTVAQLKTELVRCGLPVSGTKGVLIDRLSGQRSFPSKSSRIASVAERHASSTAGASKGSTKKMVSGLSSARGPAVMVVESPAKCATIAKFAGADYVVHASYGHVRALPSKPGSVRPTEEFGMSFELVSGANSVLKTLGAALKDARALLLATDPDREGEAIAWHVHEALMERGLLPSHLPVHRITFSEITPKAVQAALAAPRAVDLPLVRAQQARQAVDYLVGFTLSPVLWRKLPGCRSAGRVQSVALRLVTEREHAIARFVPEEHWHLQARLRPEAMGSGGGALMAQITHLGGEKLRQFDLPNEAAVSKAVATLPDRWLVSGVKRTSKQSAPPAPYNTASLQQDASRRLGFPVGRVMRLAQSLYEGMPLGGGEPVALITYMRTDGIEMSADGVAAARQYIASAYGKGDEWLPASPREFKRKARNAQEAHEAIRPVDMAITPPSLRGQIPNSELKLYELIWRRAIASQMANALHEQLALTMVPEADNEPLAAQARASGSRLVRPGFKVLAQQPSAVPRASESDEEEAEEASAGGGAEADAAAQAESAEEADGTLSEALAKFAKGDVLSTEELLPSQHFTEPPARFSEGSLVSHLEQLGIGRPSTYASIIRALQQRGYCTMVSKTLRPQERGQLVTALLTCDQLEQYVQTDFTARLEAQLDAISAGELEKTPFLADWWSHFRTAVEAVEQTDTRILREEVADKCAWTLFPTADVVPPPSLAGVATQPATPLERAATLPTANGHAAPANGHASPAEAAARPPRPERACPSCGVGQMGLKFSRYGPFVGCSEYPSCGWTRRPREPWADADAQPAIDKMALGPLRAGALPEAPAHYAGLEVSVRDGPVGWYVQLGGNVSHEQSNLAPPPDVKALKVAQLREELERRGMAVEGKKTMLVERLLSADDLRPLVPHKRVSLPADVKPLELTMDMAERLLSLPRTLGVHPEHGGAITLRTGRFGPYVAVDEVMAAGEAADGEDEVRTVLCSLPKRVSLWEVDAAQAAALLDAKAARDEKKRAAGGATRGRKAAASSGGRAKASPKRKPSAAAKAPAKKKAAPRKKKAAAAA